ncbi:MAG: DUF47 family protein [Clostridia bacterium]|nr:DUF47 family protein [Clostridia bacterium]
MKKEDYNYFDEFITMADYIVQSAEILKDVFVNFHIEKLEEKTTEVHKIENNADRIIHKMRNHLIKDFLPPIDREDIALIGHKLDDIEDEIDEILINIKILNVTEIKEEVNEIADILLQSANAVKEMFLNFKNFKKMDLIKQKIIEVNELEEKGDKIFEKIMSSLYRTEINPFNLIKWSHIYNWLENAIDCCEQVSDCVEDVILSNS